jgi:hypothetical protein
MPVKTETNGNTMFLSFEDFDINEFKSLNFIDFLIDFNTTRYRFAKFEMSDIVAINSQLHAIFESVRQDLVIWNINKVTFYLRFDFNYLNFNMKGFYPIIGPYDYVSISMNYKEISDIKKPLLAEQLDLGVAKNGFFNPIVSGIYSDAYKLLKLLSSIFNISFTNNIWLGKKHKVKIENYTLTTSDQKSDFKFENNQLKFSFELFSDSVQLFFPSDNGKDSKRTFTLPIEYVASFSVEQFSQFLNVFFESHYKEKIGANNIGSFLELKEMEMI